MAFIIYYCRHQHHHLVAIWMEKAGRLLSIKRWVQICKGADDEERKLLLTAMAFIDYKHTNTQASKRELKRKQPDSQSVLTIVMEQLLNQVHVRQKHSSAAVPSQAEFIQGVAFGSVLLEEGQVGVPLVADNLAASEATNRDDH